MKLLWLCNMVPGRVKQALDGSASGGGLWVDSVLDGLTDALNGARERGITAAEAGGRIKYGQLTAIYGLKDCLDGLADR